jgi:hypothetical protein
MRKPRFASKKSRSYTGWWKHAGPFGKRRVNKSEQSGAKRELKELALIELLSSKSGDYK